VSVSRISALARRLVIAAGALAFAAACSSSGSNGAPFSVPGKPVSTNQVEAARSYRFAPAVIQVAAGSTVTWTNHDQFPHTVQLLTGPDRSTRDLNIGQSVSVRFDQAGTYYYRCSLHPSQMHGKVVVQ
jgi:plastocyanin